MSWRSTLTKARLSSGLPLHDARPSRSLSNSSSRLGHHGHHRPRKRHRLIRLLVWLVLLVSLQLLHSHGYSALDLLRDKTRPSTFFHFFHLSARSILIFRAWRVPRVMAVREAEGYTKFHTRSRVLSKLRYGPPAKSYTCDQDGGPLAYIGMFSTWEEGDRRNSLRNYQMPQLERINGAVGGGNERPVVEIEFILGRPPSEKNMTLLKEEMALFKDIVILDVEENMNLGKTYEFFRYLAMRQEKGHPKFAFKADVDSFVAVSNLVAMLQTMECSDLYYMGRCSEFTCGMDRAWPPFFTGGFYGLSSPLYQWLGHAHLSGPSIRGPEDVRTAQLLLSLRPADRAQLKTLHLDGRLKDLKYIGGDPLAFDPDTILAIHAWKNETMLKSISDKIRDNDEAELARKRPFLGW